MLCMGNSTGPLGKSTDICTNLFVGHIWAKLGQSNSSLFLTKFELGCAKEIFCEKFDLPITFFGEWAKKNDMVG